MTSLPYHHTLIFPEDYVKGLIEGKSGGFANPGILKQVQAVTMDTDLLNDIFMEHVRAEVELILERYESAASRRKGKNA